MTLWWNEVEDVLQEEEGGVIFRTASKQKARNKVRTPNDTENAIIYTSG